MIRILSSFDLGRTAIAGCAGMPAVGKLTKTTKTA